MILGAVIRETRKTAVNGTATPPSVFLRGGQAATRRVRGFSVRNIYLQCPPYDSAVWQCAFIAKKRLRQDGGTYALSSDDKNTPPTNGMKGQWPFPAGGILFLWG